MGTDDPFQPTWWPLDPGPQPVPLTFPFEQARQVVAHLEELVDRIDRVIDDHRGLVEHALVDFEGRSADAFRVRTDLLLRRWLVERDRVARELESVEEQVAAARVRVDARDAERQSWRSRRDWYDRVLGGS